MDDDEILLAIFGLIFLSSLFYATFWCRRHVLRWPSHLQAQLTETVFACMRPAFVMLIALIWAGTTLWFKTPPNKTGWLYQSYGAKGELYATLLFTALLFFGALAYIIHKVRSFLRTWRAETSAQPSSLPPKTSRDDDVFGPPDFG